MSANRRRHANVVPLASILMWILVCAFVGGAGLGYVSLKNQLHEGADEIRKLEREIGQTSTRITDVKNEINKRTSVESLRKQYEADKSKLGGLVEIPVGASVSMERVPDTSLAASDSLQQTSSHSTNR